MQRFGADRVKGIMMRLAPEDDVPMDISILSKQIETAQKRVEAHNYDIRKNVLQYDDVMNKQREIIYGQRRAVLMGEDISESVMRMIEEAVDSRLGIYCQANLSEEMWDIGGLAASLEELTGVKFQTNELAEDIKNRNAMRDRIMAGMKEIYGEKETEISSHGIDMREVERIRLLRAVDTHWMDHIDAMTQLRQGIGLRAMAQKDPVIEYRNAGFDMFDEMVAGIRELTVRTLYHTTVKVAPQQREQVAKPLNLYLKREIGQNA